MKTFKIILQSIVLVFLLGSTNIWAQDAKEIIHEAEKRQRGVKSMEADVTMTIVRPSWQREMSMTLWSEGTEYSLIVVKTPARDKGMANLKRGKEVWTWMPRIERSIKLPPSMMSQSWMGSDFTNDDLVREFSLTNDYDHTLLGEEVVEGRACWKIELIPTEDAAVVWGKVLLWIDKDEYLTMKGEYYDEDDELVNVMQGSGVKEMDGRLFVTKMTISPVDKEGHQTIMEFTQVKFDGDIPDTYFTVQYMKRIRG